MPNAPRTFRPAGYQQREKAWASRQAPGRGWYNTARWRKLREMQLAEHPLCEECERKGNVMPANECDHITPHNWNEDAFWDGPFQSLCKPCHSQKTKREQLMGKGQKRFVICGLPGTGKSTWVRERARTGDIVWDVDAVAGAVFSMPSYPRPAAIAQALAAMRTMLLRNADSIDGDVYVIENDETKARLLANDIGAAVIRIECGEDERQARISSRLPNVR